MRYDDVSDEKVRRIGGFTHQSDHRGNRTAFPCRMICSACGINLSKQAGSLSMPTAMPSKPSPNLTKAYQAALPAGDVRSRLCDWVVRKYSLPGLTGSAALPLPFLPPFLSPPSPFFLAPAFLGAAACGGGWRATALGQPGVTVKTSQEAETSVSCLAQAGVFNTVLPWHTLA